MRPLEEAAQKVLLASIAVGLIYGAATYGPKAVAVHQIPNDETTKPKRPCGDLSHEGEVGAGVSATTPDSATRSSPHSAKLVVSSRKERGRSRGEKARVVP